MSRSIKFPVSVALGALSVLAAATAVYAASDVKKPGDVDVARLAKADSEPGQWMSPGRDKNSSYYSPLKQINDKNASKLGHAWTYDLGTYRGQEATPIVVDGVMYTSGIWGRVYAVNAATGEEIWTFDPEVDGQWARQTCCDVVNRGLSVWKGRVYVSATDGRLIALDAATGEKVWSVQTFIDKTKPYGSTGAPQIAGNVVVVGNAGADLGKKGVRGYVAAYDLNTGDFKWRFYTVPGAPGAPSEHPEMDAAQKTWDPKRSADVQGGGTAWDGFAYDPETNLVYVGTGNGSPYDQRKRSPNGGDNLYLSSILAINADTGRLAWHYQTTPGDMWDYTATAKLILADLTISGKKRQVIMQAPKNGFFYVLDRKTGELLSAKNYSYVNWASHVDMKTGRPVRTKQGDYFTGPKLVYPSWSGAHSWQPMAYNPQTGLVYIPVIDTPNIWVDMETNGGRLGFVNGFFNTAGLTPDGAYDAKALKPMFGKLPERKDIKAPRPGPLVREMLRAWDPVKQKVVWERETSNGYRSYDGGAMTTAGNLVFQGRGDGYFVVYSADTGKELKKVFTGNTIMAAPMTYTVNGEQYVAVQAGYGGTAIVTPISPNSAANKYLNQNRIIAFKLGGDEVPKPPLRDADKVPTPPTTKVSAEQIAVGEVKFNNNCAQCHVLGVVNITPDLTKIQPGTHETFKQIVLGGIRAPLGMPRFDDTLKDADVDEIHAYLIDEQRKAYELQQKAANKTAQKK